MKISKKKPPIFDEAKKRFDFDEKITVFTYGDTIYNPGKNPIDDVLIAHESVHMRQQGDDPHSWWMKYLDNRDFRLHEEMEAYHAQYEFIKTVYLDRNSQYKYLGILARIFASPVYRLDISRNYAERIIKNGKL